MSALALTGAVLMVLMLNVAPSLLPGQLTGDLHLFFVLFTLFMGVITFITLKDS